MRVIGARARGMAKQADRVDHDTIEVGEDGMPTTKRLTLETVNFDDREEMDAFEDQMMTLGLERIRAEGDELRRRGVIDEHGNVLLKDLPADMQEGAERDFGG